MEKNFHRLCIDLCALYNFLPRIFFVSPRVTEIFVPKRVYRESRPDKLAAQGHRVATPCYNFHLVLSRLRDLFIHFAMH